jgi:integrase
MNSGFPTQPKTAIENRKSGQEVAKQNLLGHSAFRPEVRRSLSRTHADYWKARLFRPTYTRDGEDCEVNDLAIRIQHGGRREAFTLHTTNRDAAAVKARDIFTTIKGAGWDAAIRKFKPDQDAAPKLDTSIGDFLGAVRETGGLRLRTFLNYANCLRTIAAEAFRVRPDKGTSKYDYRTGGNKAWTDKIDAVRLDKLTSDLVNAWMRQRVSRAGHSEIAQASARRTVNSYIRCARSLFAPGILKNLRALKLPEPLPFAGVELLESGSMKYVSRINAETLIAAAKRELKPGLDEQGQPRPGDPEAYKAFLLGLFAGMRKGEIDLAEWRMVDFAHTVIRLEPTEWLHLKTHDSAAEITVDAEVIAELREFMPQATGPFIVECLRPPRNDSPRPYYRCAPVFRRLNAWLRKKGIASNKPLHELRKEVGALIATQHGIYAASRYLRHSDITTTARHYADQKARINVGLGKLLDTTIKPADRPAQPTKTA